MTAITMPTLTAARLVAGSIDHLWQQWAHFKDMPGCCTTCCAPCKALKDFHDDGQLDWLYGVYQDSVGGGHECWDPGRRQIHRKWLTEAWAVDLGCHEDGAA